MEIYIMHNGEQLGPFSLENVRAQIDSGNLSASDYAWSVDIDDWTSLNDVLSQTVRDPPRNETRQEQRRAGRIGTALRVMRSFVERQLTPKTVLAVTVLLLVASWIYPPWVLNARSHGWFFVFDTTHNLIMQVDFGRLFLIDAIIAAAGGLVAWAAFHNSKHFRAAVHLAVYSLLTVPLIAVVCLGAVLIQRQIITKGRFGPFGEGGLIPIGGQLSQTGENNVSQKATATPNAQLQLEPVDETAVAPSDLKKIIVFDVGAHGYKYSITGLYGRVRNGLARAVQKIGVKASFYSSEGELIEVRTFWIKRRAGGSWEERVFPNAPISFDEYFSVDHLPDGYKYQLEITEAHYVN